MAVKRAEVLAPCGSPECAEAAIRGGADAIYLGYGDFNARRNAKNFTLSQLKETVKLCHSHSVAVHVALNTLVFPDELDNALKTAKEAAQAGADAFIIQDMGLFSLIKRELPHIPLHASTQCSVHSLEGALELYRAGFKRIVLARELTEKEILEIRQGLPDDAELEAFVHGALCMSVSGQCYFSALLGGRSGNRGLCAQTCRLPFSCKGRQNALSLKDLSLIDHIERLKNAGVESFKIEGRMKRPEYVAIASYNVRCAVDNVKVDEEARELLKSAFSRSGFTDGYFTDRRGETMFGIRRKEDTEGERVFQRINELTRRVYPRLPLLGNFTVTEESAILSVTDKTTGTSVTVKGEKPQLSKKPSSGERIKECLEKTGGTSCFFEELEINLPTHFFVPVSQVNEMRREAIAELMAKRDLNVNEVREEASLINGREISSAVYAIRAEGFDRLPGFIPENSRIILPIESITEEEIKLLLEKGYDVCAELPPLVFSQSAGERASEKLKRLKGAGLTSVFCHNVGQISLINEAGLIPFGSYRLNITNNKASDFYRSRGVLEQVLSFELSLPRMSRIADKNTWVFSYGRLPVMLTRSCPLSGERGCADCKGEGEDFLKDRMGEEFPLLCRGGYSEIFNSRPLYMGHRQDKLNRSGISRYLLYFTDETAKEASFVTRLFVSQDELKSKFTRGLYFK